MKPTVSWMLSCLLLTFPVDLLFTDASYGTEPVFDTDENELRRGYYYYAVPPRRLGGGIAPETGRNHSCPYQIVQTHNRRSDGVPVAFSPVDPSDRFILTDTDLNIYFDDFPSVVVCPEPSFWTVNSGIGNSGSSPGATPILVTTGGVEGNPGPETLSNWFKIQEYEDGYIIRHCPSTSLCGSSKPCEDSLLCENIGISVVNGRMRLALSRQPLKVVFKRVKRCSELVATN